MNLYGSLADLDELALINSNDAIAINNIPIQELELRLMIDLNVHVAKHVKIKLFHYYLKKKAFSIPRTSKERLYLSEKLLLKTNSGSALATNHESSIISFSN